MQTFLPETTFWDSAATLDNVRLNKQLLEGYQIMNAIFLTPDGGGSRVDGKVPFASNHPATNMWRGHEFWLLQYLGDVEQEARLRGIKTDKNWDNIQTVYQKSPWTYQDCNTPEPNWWLDPLERERVLWTHRANLYRKDPIHYAQYKSDSDTLDRHYKSVVCCPDKHAPYYYPTHVR